MRLILNILIIFFSIFYFQSCGQEILINNIICLKKYCINENKNNKQVFIFELSKEKNNSIHSKYITNLEIITKNL